MRREGGREGRPRALLYRVATRPCFDGAELDKVKVEAVVAEHLKGEKIRVFKYRPKKRYRKRAGAPVLADAARDQGNQGAGAPRRGRVRSEGRPAKKKEEEEGRQMAHKKGLGSSRNGRDSQAKRLGVKVFAGRARDAAARSSCASAAPASSRGPGAGIGRDDTIFATRPGAVEFRTGRKGRTISILPE